MSLLSAEIDIYFGRCVIPFRPKWDSVSADGRKFKCFFVLQCLTEQGVFSVVS